MRKIGLYIVLVLISAFTLKAQSTEDALRLFDLNGTYSPRSGALGTAFYGISDDNTALYYNPAGFSSLPNSEISVGFGFDNVFTETNAFSIITPLKSTSAYMTNLSISAPFVNSVGKGSIAISYNLLSNFNRTFSTEFFNNGESFINYNTRTGSPNDGNMSYYLYLCDTLMRTPINDSLQQYTFVTESGGIHSLSGGTGFDISDIFAIGFTINFNYGSYEYAKNLTETDSKNLYRVYDDIKFTDLDFKSLNYDEKISQSFFGVSGSLGLMAKINNFFRAGFTIKLPVSYDIEESSSQTAKATYDNGAVSKYPYKNELTSSYSIYVPFVFALGVSTHFKGLTLSTGFEYSDASQLQFSDGVSELNELNRQIINNFVGRNSIGIAAEYEIPGTILTLRASYDQINSVLKTETANSIIVFSGGFGLLLTPNMRMEGLIRTYDRSQYFNYYGDTNYNLKTNPVTIQLGFTIR